MDSEGGLASVQGIDRRKLLKRMAVAGGVVVGAPVVLSTPAHAFTTVDSGAGFIRNVNPTVSGSGSPISLAVPVGSNRTSGTITVTVQSVSVTAETGANPITLGTVTISSGASFTAPNSTATTTLSIPYTPNSGGSRPKNGDQYNLNVRLRFSYTVGSDTFLVCWAATYRVRSGPSDSWSGGTPSPITTTPAEVSCS